MYYTTRGHGMQISNKTGEDLTRCFTFFDTSGRYRFKINTGGKVQKFRELITLKPVDSGYLFFEPLMKTDKTLILLKNIFASNDICIAMFNFGLI